MLRSTRRLHLAALALSALAASSSSRGESVVRTVVGGGPAHRQANGVITWGVASVSVVVEPGGDLLIANGQATIYRLRSDGWSSVHYADSAPSAQYCGLAIERTGDLLVADCQSDRLLRVNPAGAGAVTVAGNGTTGFSGDGGPATQASLSFDTRWNEFTVGITTDPGNNIFISDTLNHRVRRIDAATGVITTVAGIGPCSAVSDGVPATSACLMQPRGLAFDGAGNLFVVDRPFDGLVRRIDAATSTLTVVAGGGPQYNPLDVPARQARLNTTSGIVIDAAGNLYLADPDYDTPAGGRFRPVLKVDAMTGILSAFAGNGERGLCGDGGPASDACLPYTASITLDPEGNLVVVDAFNRAIRRVDLPGDTIDTVVVTGCLDDGSVTGPLLERCLGSQEGILVEPGGTLLVTAGHQIAKVDESAESITPMAGNGCVGFWGDGGLATEACLNSPGGASLDTDGNLYFSDIGNQRVRRVDRTTGVITTVAGDGVARYAGDGGPAISASLNSPRGLAFDPQGNLLITDLFNNRIRRLDRLTGVITTVAGDGVARYGGDGGPATAASLNRPLSILSRAGGDLLIADRSNHRIRRIDATTGLIETLAGTGVAGFDGDGGPASLAMLMFPGRLAMDGADGLLFGDEGNRRIRRIDLATGVITTIAGDGTLGFNGDGREPLDTALTPRGLAVDAGGRILFADLTGSRIRALTRSAPASGEVEVTAGMTPSGDLRLSWDRSCVRTDYDYAVYEGSLTDLTGHVPRSCTTDGRDSVTLTPMTQSAYYLVVPRNALREGSYGRDSGGSERLPADVACVPQFVSESCL